MIIILSLEFNDFLSTFVSHICMFSSYMETDEEFLIEDGWENQKASGKEMWLKNYPFKSCSTIQFHPKKNTWRVPLMRRKECRGESIWLKFACCQESPFYFVRNFISEKMSVSLIYITFVCKLSSFWCL